MIRFLAWLLLGLLAIVAVWATTMGIVLIVAGQ